MKLLLLIFLAALSHGHASIIPINPVPTTYAISTTPVVTAHSHQVVARNYNRVYVPTVATVGYPHYSTWNTYPYTYRHATYPYAYAGYPYGYGSYPYAPTVW